MIMRISVIAALVAVAGPVVAESQIARPDSTDSAAVRLSPVTVTATRTETSTFAVPLAVSVIGKPELENKRGYSLDEAVSVVPGVFAQSRYGTSDIRLVIRGFGARGAGDRSNAGTSRGIRVLIDGIPETEPDGRTSFDLVDLAAANRLEVVRSNSSALWGNAGGGVVAISTVPIFDHQFASLQQIAGSYGFLRTVAQAGLPLGPASLAMTFTNTSQEGYRAHSDSRRALVNASLTSPLGESTELGVFIAAANDLFHIPGPLTLAEATSDPRSANATYASRDERRYNRLGRIGITLRHELSDESSLSALLFSNPKNLQRSERGTYRDFNRHHVGGNLVYRTGYRLTPTIAATTIVGAEGATQDGAILFYSLSPDARRGTELRDNKAEGATNAGMFAQQQLMFGERLGVDVGARWDNIRYDYRSYIDPSLDDVRNFSRISPRIGVNYRLSPTHSFYAGIGGGVEAPAGNETDPASTFGQDTVTAINPLLDPIHSTTYEVGTKRLMTFPSGAFSVFSYELALYDTHVTNEIIPYRGGRFYFTAGKARRSGVELGAALAGASQLEISGSLTLARNHYVEYTVDSVHYGSPGRVADYSGNDIAGVPSLFYSAGVAKSLGNTIPLRLSVSARGTGDYFIDDANAVEVAGYTTFGAGLSTASGISFGGVSLRAFFNVENIGNRRYIGSAFVNPDVVNGVPVAFEPAAGRTYIVSLSVGSQRK
jgi:iron complex outermembrane receptor protein